MRLYFSRKFCLFQALFSTFFLPRFSVALRNCLSFAHFRSAGVFAAALRVSSLCITKSPLLRAFRVSCFRNYLRGFLIFACAAAWMSEAASAHFIPRNYLRGFLMLACAAASVGEAASAYFIPRNYLRGFLIFACAAASVGEAASAHFIPRNYLRGFLIFACAAASLAIGTRKGEQET